MRLAILDSGHGFRTKVLFAFIRAVSRLPVPDAVKLNRYRPDFYGTPMRALAQEALRGPSAWSVGDRELMGAFVSKTNNCEVCTKTHAAVAALAYQDEATVSAALSDLEAAPIEEPLRATLHMLRKLTREHKVDADDMRAVLAAGVSREQIEDALAVCFTFNRRSAVAYLRVLRAQSPGLRGRREVPARARLPLTAGTSHAKNHCKRATHLGLNAFPAGWPDRSTMTNMKDQPIVCTLSSAALQARRTGLLSQLIQRTRDHQELPDGHRFVFDATEDMVPTVARVIDAERRCCRFLRFHLIVEPDGGPILLDLTGPPGTQEFILALLDA